MTLRGVGTDFAYGQAASSESTLMYIAKRSSTRSGATEYTIWDSTCQRFELLSACTEWIARMMYINAGRVRQCERNRGANQSFRPETREFATKNHNKGSFVYMYI